MAQTLAEAGPAYQPIKIGMWTARVAVDGVASATVIC
jgi:hypothetical protein